MARIFKALFTLGGGLLMTTACFQPWLYEIHPQCFSIVSHCSVAKPVNVFDIMIGAQVYGVISVTTAATLLISSLALVVMGFFGLFRADAWGLSPLVHLGTVLWVIGIVGENNGAFGGVIERGPQLMFWGWVAAGIGVFLIRLREKTPKATGKDVQAPVSSNVPTTKAE